MPIICIFWIMPFFEKVFWLFLSTFALFIFETSGTFGLLQNKHIKFRRWVVTQKRTKTISFRTERASAPRKKKHRNKQWSEIYLFATQHSWKLDFCIFALHAINPIHASHFHQVFCEEFSLDFDTKTEIEVGWWLLNL